MTHGIVLLLVAGTTVGITTGQVTNETEEAQQQKQVVYVAKRGWHSDFAAAQTEAERLGKPLLLHFYADWCGPCRSMEQGVLNTSQVVAELGSSVVGVKINSDHHPDLTSRFGVVGLPTDVFVSPEGSVVTRTSGSSAVSSYVASMTRIGARYAGNEVDESAEEVKRVSEEEIQDADSPLLNGYCPVAITDNRLWEKGSPEFAVMYKGQVYHLTDEDQLHLFETDPERFAPAMLGYDAVELSNGSQQVSGDIRFGAFYRGRLYLLSSEENRRRFIENPAWYAQEVYVLQVEKNRTAGVQ